MGLIFSVPWQSHLTGVFKYLTVYFHRITKYILDIHIIKVLLYLFPSISQSLLSTAQRIMSMNGLAIYSICWGAPNECVTLTTGRHLQFHTHNTTKKNRGKLSSWHPRLSITLEGLYKRLITSGFFSLKFDQVFCFCFALSCVSFKNFF